MVEEYQQLVKSLKKIYFNKKKQVYIYSITLSCRNVHSIFISRKARRAATTDWKTFGIFFNATRRLVRGSVTAHITPNAP